MYNLSVNRKNRIRAKMGLSNPVMMMTFGFVLSAHAATWYVDSTATGAKNGTSWANAWTALSQIANPAAGDTVYISGGPSGGSQTYNISAPWVPTSGSASGGRVTYQIGQDALHNGTAVFNCAGLNSFISGNPAYINFVGDAGDGKMHFSIASDLTGQLAAFTWSGATSNVRIGYVNLNSQGNEAFDFFQGASSVEVDHTYYNGTPSANEDHCFTIDSYNQTWDNSLIHDNTWRMAHAVPESNMGDDGLQGKNWSGVSIYNNSLIGVGVSNYQGGQHQDAAQPLGGDHIKYYNNYIQDMVNYAFYGDAFYGGFTSVYLYNNVVALITPGVQNNPGAAGLVIGSELTNAPFNDIVVCNNIVADYASHIAIAIGTGGSGSISYGSNLRVENNIVTNNQSGTPIRPDSHFTNSNNVVSSGVGYFVSYTANKANTANFHLVSPDTTLIGAGANLTSVSSFAGVTLDRDGNQRPATGSWNIGPYGVTGSGPGGEPSNLRIISSQ
jgi:hypothetical protein